MRGGVPPLSGGQSLLSVALGIQHLFEGWTDQIAAYQGSGIVDSWKANVQFWQGSILQSSVSRIHKWSLLNMMLVFLSSPLQNDYKEQNGFCMHNSMHFLSLLKILSWIISNLQSFLHNQFWPPAAVFWPGLHSHLVLFECSSLQTKKKLWLTPMTQGCIRMYLCISPCVGLNAVTKPSALCACNS